MAKPLFSSDQIVMYETKDGQTHLEVKLQDETVWLSLTQLANLFGRDKSVISRHLRNIFVSKELSEKAVVANFATTAEDGKIYQVDYYNLDVIISVGYRVNSKSATQFRVWATGVLKSHILKGYSLNQKRLDQKGLDEFEQAISLMRKTIETKQLTSGEESGLLKIVTTYAHTWLLLRKYDDEELSIPEKLQQPTFVLAYSQAIQAIGEMKRTLVRQGEAFDIFGIERSEMLAGILGNIYQSFGGRDMYETVEEKAAHLLYFVIKDHPFSDGNKRIGSFLFIWFLVRNHYLYDEKGEKKINDNALVVLALLVAESDPRQKEMMVRLIMHFLAE